MSAILRSPWTRLAFTVAAAAGVGFLLWWHGPAWGAIGDAFAAVEWRWVAVAVALNLLSVVARAFAWRTVIYQAIPEPHPSFGPLSPRSLRST